MDLLTDTTWWCHLPVMRLALGSKEIELEIEKIYMYKFNV
jgi:hypothetical protein